MRKSVWFILICILSALLAACGGDDSGDATSEGNQQLGPLDWNRDPNNIILRVDQRLNEGPPAQLLSEIPLCTLWGDGRIVWVNRVTDGGSSLRTEILQSRLTDDAIRSLIENVVFTGFYDWESNFLIPDFDNPLIQSISLNLFAEERTVSRYTDWPVDGFERIRQACAQASTTPITYLPEGLWVSAYEIIYDTNYSYWRWYEEAAGFQLSEVSNGQAPRWITGDLAKQVFTNTLLSSNTSYVLEGDIAYSLAIQMPGITRDAPPAPQSDPAQP